MVDISNEVNSVGSILSPLIIPMYSWTGERLRDFNIGLSRDSPEVSDPRNMTYCICDQYNGTSFNGEIIQVNCTRQCDTGRFVIIHMPYVVDNLHLSEVEVYEGKTNSNDFHHCFILLLGSDIWGEIWDYGVLQQEVVIKLKNYICVTDKEAWKITFSTKVFRHPSFVSDCQCNESEFAYPHTGITLSQVSPPRFVILSILLTKYYSPQTNLYCTHSDLYLQDIGLMCR